MVVVLAILWLYRRIQSAKKEEEKNEVRMSSLEKIEHFLVNVPPNLLPIQILLLLPLSAKL